MDKIEASVADTNVEPDTLHRRGHWFKSSIAHHGNDMVISLPHISFRLPSLICVILFFDLESR